jgi:hypothetical protein
MQPAITPAPTYLHWLSFLCVLLPAAAAATRLLQKTWSTRFEANPGNIMQSVALQPYTYPINPSTQKLQHANMTACKNAHGAPKNAA